MVETPALLRAGERSGAVGEDAILVGVQQGWRLIAAPEATDTSSYALIFWEPEDQDDQTPTFDKVVGHILCGN